MTFETIKRNYDRGLWKISISRSPEKNTCKHWRCRGVCPGFIYAIFAA